MGFFNLKFSIFLILSLNWRSWKREKTYWHLKKYKSFFLLEYTNIIVCCHTVNLHHPVKAIFTIRYLYWSIFYNRKMNNRVCISGFYPIFYPTEKMVTFLTTSVWLRWSGKKMSFKRLVKIISTWNRTRRLSLIRYKKKSFWKPVIHFFLFQRRVQIECISPRVELLVFKHISYYIHQLLLEFMLFIFNRITLYV